MKSKSVKLLEQLLFDEKVKQYPNTPVEWLAPITLKDTTANGLTKCIIEFLKLKGHHAERTGNEGRMIDGRKTFTDVIGKTRMVGTVKRIKSSGERGTSDIKAVINGKMIAIEVKIGTDRQSEYQREYQRKIESAGGTYLIAKDFESFYNWYNELPKLQILPTAGIF